MRVDDHPFGSGGGGYAVFLGRMHPTRASTRRVTFADAGMPLRIAAKIREPAEKTWFASTVKPLLSDEITYVGELGPADKLALLADAVCLLNPIAWSEPFGMVMIESLACGTPVVVTPCGAAREIVDDGVTGFVRASIAGLTLAAQRTPSLNRRACPPQPCSGSRPTASSPTTFACYERTIERAWTPTTARSRATLVA